MISGDDKGQSFRRDTDIRSQLPAGRFLIDKSGMIHEADQTGAVQFGAKMSSLAMTSFLSRVLWDDRDIFTAHLRMVFEKQERQSCEVRLVRENGSVFHSYIRSVALKNGDEEGDVCRTTVRDISFITQLEKMLLREKHFSESLMRGSIDGIVAFDSIYQVTEWNPAMEKMTGMPQRDCLGKNIFSIFPFLKKIGEDRYLDAALQGRKVTSRNRHYHAAGAGRDVYFDAHYSPVRDDSGNVCGVVAVIRDVTDLMEKENELLRARRLETISSLASGFAHDYNNLLTGILGNVSLAKLHMSPHEKPFELVDKASKIILRARDLTRQLTMLASGEELAKKPAFIGQMLKDLLNLAFSGSDISTQCVIDGNLWPVEIDEGRIWQAIYALMVHMKQSLGKKGRITLGAENAIISRDSSLPLLEGKYVLISLAQDAHDSHGSTTSASSFSMSSATAKDPERNSALKAAFNIINNHQGYISVDASGETGTILNIFLPAAQDIAGSDAQQAAIPIAGKGNVLIMDDDEDVRDIAGKILNHMGYDTAFAQDGDEAVRAYMDAMNSGRPFDIVILDLTIQGGMGGREAIARLLDIDPDARAIVSSGHSRDPVMREFAKYGFRGSITKPFRIGELSEIVSNNIR